MKIKHDFHIHTLRSLCADPNATLDTFTDAIKREGLEKIGVSNHFWDAKIPPLSEDGYFTMQNLERISLDIPAIEKLREDTGIKVYFGCEAEYDPVHHDVAVAEETCEKLDFIIVPNSHTHLVMPKEYWDDFPKHKEFLVTAYRDIINSKVSKYITAVAHPFEIVGYSDERLKLILDTFTDDEFKRLFDETAERGIAYEINVSGMRLKTKEQIDELPKMRLYRLAKECGCKFIFGSDAHGQVELDYYSKWTEYVSELLGLTEDDIIEIAR